MPQQTKTEALEELARLIRRDIMNGTARLNETWWFDDDTKMQDRIAHVLLDYSDEEKPTAPPKAKPIMSDFAALLQEFGPPPFVTTSGAALSWLHDQILKTDRAADERTEKAQREANKQIDALNEKCAALVVERNSLAAENAGLHRQCDDLRISMGRATPLRIDTDMSDPQPGKLLVVRLDADDVGRAWVPLGEMSDRGRETQNFWPEQRVGFLVGGA